jgi:hypothetical protein
LLRRWCVGNLEHQPEPFLQDVQIPRNSRHARMFARMRATCNAKVGRYAQPD